MFGRPNESLIQDDINLFDGFYQTLLHASHRALKNDLNQPQLIRPPPPITHTHPNHFLVAGNTHTNRFQDITEQGTARGGGGEGHQLPTSR